LKKSKPFQFKQFSVHQEQSAMKVGTDGVLLGAWIVPGDAQNILDIGCGTALISLMLAQRSKAKITAIEIEPKAAEEAQFNVKESQWSNQIKVIHQSFQDCLINHKQSYFDLIVCNPPYYQSNQTKGQRSLARENEHLPYSLLVHGASQLLSKEGKLCVIVPAPESDELLRLAKMHELHPAHITFVAGNKDTAIKRHLIQLERKASTPLMNTLIIEHNRNNYTEEYQNLLKDYLLIF